MTGIVLYLNPQGLHHNPAFSQLVVVNGPARTIYIGGQNAVDASGQIVGRGDLGAQAAQVARNLRVALTAADATIDHVVKWTISVVQGQPLGPGLAAFQQAFGARPHPPAITFQFVAGLANPEYLIEVEAVAVVPER